MSLKSLLTVVVTCALLSHAQEESCRSADCAEASLASSLDVSDDDATLLQLSDTLHRSTLHEDPSSALPATGSKTSERQGFKGHEKASHRTLALESQSVNVDMWMRLALWHDMLVMTGSSSVVGVTLGILVVAALALLVFCCIGQAAQKGEDRHASPLYPMPGDGAATSRTPPNNSSRSPGPTVNSSPGGFAMLTTAQSAGPPPTCILPNAIGAIVPANRKFVIRAPCLQDIPWGHHALTKQAMVMTNDGKQMCQIKLRRNALTGQESAVSIKESLSVALPDHMETELLMCTFGQAGDKKLRCEIRKCDSGGQSAGIFGIISEDGASSIARSGARAFTLSIPNGRRLLTVMVRGPMENKNIKIVDGTKPSTEYAAVVPDGSTNEDYQVECYPSADVILVVIALAAVDRFAAEASAGAGQAVPLKMTR